MFSTNLLLGALAGVTIFLGLPIARWKSASEALRGWLALASAGILLFLIIEIGFHCMSAVESKATGGEWDEAAGEGLILALGVGAGLIGLAWWEARRAKLRALNAPALEIATMIAVGIGLHNFAEGLAIGQSFSGGEAKLGLVLVTGFALHNATEGFGIAGPLVNQTISWRRLAVLGLIGGAPTAVGAALGGVWVNPEVELLFLSLATGSLIYVTRELMRIKFELLRPVGAATALTAGLLLGMATEVVVEAGQASARNEASAATGAKTIVFESDEAEPGSLTVRQGEKLTIVNEAGRNLEFEGSGIFAGEVVLAEDGKRTVTVNGNPGEYKLQDERGLKVVAKIIVVAAAAVAKN